MIRFLTIFVTVLSLAIASLAAQAHGTVMAVSQAPAAQTQHMDHASSPEASCSQDKICADDAGLCDLVCGGLSVFLPLARNVANETDSREKHLRPADTFLLARAPGLDDRPPITRHL